MGKVWKPSVSVIITTKNEAKNIERLLLSIRRQTYSNIETIVVDNSSSDNTKEIAKKYTPHVYEKGPERSAQRNLGALKAKGEFLLILDADMELTYRVVADCIATLLSSDFKALVIPERTVGQGFIPKIRQFERKMYVGDPTIELARFFNKKAFFEFGGYDLKLTGPEDYDLPYRISRKYKIGRANEYILHHEEGLTLPKLLRKKFYYASRGAAYVQKHPELLKSQGNLLFRKAYLKSWKNFLRHPVLGILFLGTRILETTWAVAGYTSAVGVGGLLKAIYLMFR